MVLNSDVAILVPKCYNFFSSDELGTRLARSRY
jgi:hypothetical protein